MKVDQDIKFVKSCKKEHLVPIFAKVNLSIKSGSYKLKWKILKRENWGNKYILFELT